MFRLTISPDDPEPDVIRQAVGVLTRGGVVAFPTDTLYGLAVDPRRDDAVERLFALKRRDGRVAVPLVASDVAQALAAAELGPADVLLADAFWPGPLSIVVPARPMVSRLALGGGRTVAVRVPAHPVARALAAAFGFCVTATSANLSGARPAIAADEICGLAQAGSIAGWIPSVIPSVTDVLLLDAGALPGGPPSTIVEMRADGPALIRAGAIAWDRVLKSLQ